MVSLARLKTRFSRYGGASVFYVGILIIAGLNISSVHFSAGFNRLEASVKKAGFRRPRSIFGRNQFSSSGVTVSARKYLAPRSRFTTVGQTGAELAAASPTANATLSAYWELQIKNGRDNQLYVDLAVDSAEGPPRHPRTKEVELGTDSSRRQVDIDGKTLSILSR